MFFLYFLFWEKDGFLENNVNIFFLKNFLLKWMKFKNKAKITQINSDFERIKEWNPTMIREKDMKFL